MPRVPEYAAYFVFLSAIDSKGVVLPVIVERMCLYTQDKMADAYARSERLVLREVGGGGWRAVMPGAGGVCDIWPETLLLTAHENSLTHPITARGGAALGDH